MAAGAPQLHALPPRVVLFDGVCVFCNAAVRWLMRRDPVGRLHFAPLQGATAAVLRARHGEIPVELATAVYVDASDGTERVYVDSAAMLRAVGEIQGPWRLAAGLRHLPGWLTDFFYRGFVRNRYRWFGTHETCPIPAPGERARFLD